MTELKQLRREHKMSQQALADAMGVSRSAVAMWETGQSAPDNSTLQRLADFFTVTTDRLLGRSAIQAAADPQTVCIPVLGTVRAGVPDEALEDVLGYEEIPADMARRGDFFALQIRGDSMEPRMSPGDVVIVRRQPDVESGEIGIVLVDNADSTCKKVVKHRDGLSLVSFNSAYAPMFFTQEEVETLPVRVIGRVVELRA